MTAWGVVLVAALAAEFAVVAWYLRRSFPDGEAGIRVFRWEKTWRWGSYRLLNGSEDEKEEAG
jgi:hypothetical protein